MNLIVHILMIFFDIRYMLINREHINWLKSSFPAKSRRQKWVQDEHHRTFITWFAEQVSVNCNLDWCLGFILFFYILTYFFLFNWVYHRLYVR